MAKDAEGNKLCKCGLIVGHGGPCGQPNHPLNKPYIPVVKQVVNTPANPKGVKPTRKKRR
ncbi:hypothetical protein KJZ67_02685 [Patescibacteria group bacterium]|nr:hypothetical protein [Patescibacteria group bacterium]